jgi:uncharacterized phage protein (TIGR01671 family)
MYSPDSQIGHLWSIPEAPNGIINANGNDTLMQWTGMYDKNGKEVYDGDIINITDGVLVSQEYDFPNDDPKETYTDYVALVKFSDGYFGYVHGNADCFVPLITDEDGMEVIGNIFENDYLLSENKDD